MFQMHIVDVIVVAAYLIGSFGLGIAFRRQNDRDEFFCAGKSMGRLPVGLSVMATLFSANSFVMYPSTAYGSSIRMLAALIAFWAMGPLIIWVFIPIYTRLNCGTAYEYLEHRFHVSVRCLASALFVMLRISWMAAATYAAAVAISGISGIGQYVAIIGLGIIAVGYTMMGGLRAVMWTDVLQFFVFSGTILIAVVLLVTSFDGGFQGIANTYFADRPKMVVDLSLDPTIRFGTLAVLIGSFLEGLSAFGADQVAVQRYLAARDERTSQVGFLINLLGMLVIIPGLILIGMGLYAYFLKQPEAITEVLVSRVDGTASAEMEVLGERFQMLREANRSGDMTHVNDFYLRDPGQLHADMVSMNLSDQALPQFVRQCFPIGMLGLLVAALMAATMSSIDSGIHSVTTALIVDFRDRLFPQWRPSTEAVEMFVARGLVFVIGALAIVMACFVGSLGDVFTVAKKCVGAFAAPLLAVFVLGLFSRRAKTVGVFLGTGIGALGTLILMQQFPDWFSLWFFPLGFSLSVGVSLVFSFLGRENSGTAPITYWELRKRWKDDPDLDSTHEN